MRYLGTISVFLFGLILGFIPTASASASTLTATGEITITATVAPTHYVIVDNQDNVIEITSNTTESVIPTVFRNKITLTSQIPLSESIKAQYDEITTYNLGQIGTLYKKEPLPIMRSSSPNFLRLQGSMLSLINYLR